MSKNAIKFIVVSLILSTVVGGLTFWLTRPTGPQMTPLMRRLTDGVTKEFGEQVPVHRKVETVYILLNSGASRTPEQEFQAGLEEAVHKSGRYKIQDWKTIEKWLEQEANKVTLRNVVNKYLMGKDGTINEPTTLEQLKGVIKELDAANYPDLDGVLVVDIKEFHEGPDEDGFGAKVSVEAKLWSKREDKFVAEVGPISDEITSRLDLRYLQHNAGQTSWLLRFLLWVLISCGLPWGGIQVVRAVLKKRNNSATFTLLGLFTGVSVILAWPLLASFGTGGGTVVALLIAAGAMGYYNYDAIEYINRRLL
ncbi:MAG: hypothetical protein JKY65_26720 [Planctomycetes bacterium]|nr:hypothetical protein [Planctomycetota bacterium]